MVNEPLSLGAADLPVHSGQRVPLRIVTLGRRGRGVVAGRPIAKGELVERSPVLIIPHDERRALDPTAVGNYVFLWEPGTVGQDLYRQEGRAAVALGYTSLVNHSAAPNCEFVRHFAARVLDLIALRDIETGEELTFDYGMTLWFEPD
jgi:SET domain-containing protein